MPKVSAEHKQAVRDRLVDAAIAVMDREGPEAATTRRIQDEAGLSSGALYHYFSSKSELYVAIGQRLVPMSDSDEPSGDETLGDVVQRSLALVASLFGQTQASPLGHLRDMARHDEAIAESVAEFDRSSVQRFAPANRQAIEFGLFGDHVDPEVLVEVVQLFYEALSTREQSTGLVNPRAAVLSMFLTMLGDHVTDPACPEGPAFRNNLEEIAQ